MNSSQRRYRDPSRREPTIVATIVVVVVATRDPGEEDLTPDPGGGLAPGLDETDQGHPGGAGMMAVLARGDSRPGVSPRRQQQQWRQPQQQQEGQRQGGEEGGLL